MCTVSIYEMKTQLSKYISMVESGEEEEIVILKNGKKVASVTKYHDEKTPVRLGAGLLVTEAKPFVLKSDDDHLDTLFGY